VNEDERCVTIKDYVTDVNFVSSLLFVFCPSPHRIAFAIMSSLLNQFKNLARGGPAPAVQATPPVVDNNMVAAALTSVNAAKVRNVATVVHAPEPTVASMASSVHGNDEDVDYSGDQDDAPASQRSQTSVRRAYTDDDDSDADEGAVPPTQPSKSKNSAARGSRKKAADAAADDAPSTQKTSDKKQSKSKTKNTDTSAAPPAKRARKDTSAAQESSYTAPTAAAMRSLGSDERVVRADDDDNDDARSDMTAGAIASKMEVVDPPNTVFGDKKVAYSETVVAMMLDDLVENGDDAIKLTPSIVRDIYIRVFGDLHTAHAIATNVKCTARGVHRGSVLSLELSEKADSVRASLVDASTKTVVESVSVPVRSAAERKGTDQDAYVLNLFANKSALQAHTAAQSFVRLQQCAALFKLRSPAQSVVDNSFDTMIKCACELVMCVTGKPGFAFVDSSEAIGGTVAHVKSLGANDLKACMTKCGYTCVNGGDVIAMEQLCDSVFLTDMVQSFEQLFEFQQTRIALAPLLSSASVLSTPQPTYEQNTDIVAVLNHNRETVLCTMFAVLCQWYIGAVRRVAVKAVDFVASHAPKDIQALFGDALVAAQKENATVDAADRFMVPIVTYSKGADDKLVSSTPLSSAEVADRGVHVRDGVAGKKATLAENLCTSVPLKVLWFVSYAGKTKELPQMACNMVSKEERANVVRIFEKLYDDGHLFVTNSKVHMQVGKHSQLNPHMTVSPWVMSALRYVCHRVNGSDDATEELAVAPFAGKGKITAAKHAAEKAHVFVRLCHLEGIVRWLHSKPSSALLRYMAVQNIVEHARIKKTVKSSELMRESSNRTVPKRVRV
jgi:hypothetical protein